MVNYNPETVSTDYDMSDKLYFEELSGERVLDICDKERPYGIVVSVGGQIANNLTQKFTKYQDIFRAKNINILGTSGRNIDRAENRARFSNLLDQLNIAQPSWKKLENKSEALSFAEDVGFLWGGSLSVRSGEALQGRAGKTLEDLGSMARKVKQALDRLAESLSGDSPHRDDTMSVIPESFTHGFFSFVGSLFVWLNNRGWAREAKKKGEDVNARPYI